jgi:IS30 family transposase
MIKKKKISCSERDQIAVLLASGLSLRNIAKTLERSVSGVSEEIKRNSVGGEYKSIAANSISVERNRRSRRTNPLKSVKIFSYVFDKLREGWSPEQIAGRLKRLNKGKTVICHETIYRYIYSPDGKERHLYEYLVRHHRKRRPWHGRCLYRRGIPDRVSIRLRPEAINNKKTFGHWEADTVEGKAHQKGIQTLLERKTRLYQAKLLPNIDSEYGVKAQREILEPLPKKARKSVTFDNGRENYNHSKLQRWLNLKTYFCDPNCAWQRGSNEYHNGLLRRYIPKRADLTYLTQVELDEIVREINNQPRKCLQYQTPKEAFRKELKYIKCSDST